MPNQVCSRAGSSISRALNCARVARGCTLGLDEVLQVVVAGGALQAVQLALRAGGARLDEQPHLHSRVALRGRRGRLAPCTQAPSLSEAICLPSGGVV